MDRDSDSAPHTRRCPIRDYVEDCVTALHLGGYDRCRIFHLSTQSRLRARAVFSLHVTGRSLHRTALGLVLYSALRSIRRRGDPVACPQQHDADQYNLVGLQHQCKGVLGLLRTIMRWGTSSVYRIRQYVQMRLGLFPIVHEDCDIAPSASFSCVTNLTLGHHVYIGPHSFVEAKGGITIDDGVVISSRVTILSSTHNYESLESIPYGGEDILRSVRIERGAWICYGALILPGVTIGEGAIVGAGAVVTKPIAPGHIVGGNPAQVIGTRRGEAWRGLLDNGLYRLKKKGTAMPTSS
ncbi:MAG: hypothetical protein CV089_10255 [Nitrospira sp. WS110]|nr:hypothetical protein [Nitrospira sp. WS110]